MKLAIKISLIAIVALAFSSLSAVADTMTYLTPTGSVEPADGSHVVDAEAIVTTADNGTVTLQLFNLDTAAQMHDAGQLLSDFMFTLTGTFAAVSNTNENTPTGTLIDLNGGTLPAIGKWGFSDSSSAGSTTFHVDDLNNGNSPTQTIIGGTAGESAADYTNVNSSLTKNHNPFLQGEETFVLNIAGVTSNTAITAGVFSFGTESGGNITGVPSTGAVPEPRTTSFILAGGLVMAFALRRKKLVSR
jgi:hypothetical protein